MEGLSSEEGGDSGRQGVVEAEDELWHHGAGMRFNFCSTITALLFHSGLTTPI